MLLRLLASLHARGLHAAVLAAMLVMPTVAAVGFLTRAADHDGGREPNGAELRPTLADPPASAER